MGELAALATAFFWTLTSVFFTIGGREVGSVMVNRLRLLLAVLFLAVTHLAVQGTLWPVAAGPERWFWLGLSGIIGLAVGDAFLFQGYVMVGPRLSMLMMALVPVISTLLAWVFLAETLSLLEIGAVALTVGGIVWVVLERRNGATPAEGRHYTLGILAGFGGAVGQAVGLIAAKQGLAGDFPVLSGVLIRMIVAMATVWALAALRGRV
ncbi:MAG: EamA family transporter, partial [Anaerolineae bacterium]